MLLLEEFQVPWQFSISQNLLILLALLKDYYSEVYTWYYNAYCCFKRLTTPSDVSQN